MKHRGHPLRKSRALATLLVALLTAVAGLVPYRAGAQGLPLIRDAEVEHTIRVYATPIFEAADLNPQSIDVFLVRDDSLNAFVAGGQNLFLHTGLLRSAEGPLQVMGVIAHEAGHIAGGHIAGRRQELQSSTAQMIASYVLGLATAVATGRGDAASAVIAAGQGATIAGLLSYTRSQEGAADGAAVKYLERAGYSPRGLVEFMKTLEGQEVLLSGSQDPYLRTHPLTRDRIEFLKQALRESPHADKQAPTRLNKLHRRMLAKLDGFLQPPRRTLREYESDNGVPARYARAIAHYRVPDLDAALPIIDGLIEEFPDDPYFHELKGQMLFEHGRLREALPAYEKAVALEPNSALLRLGLARVQIELNTPDLNQPALENLKQVLAEEPHNAFAWRLRAVAHGRAGDRGLTALSLAEARLAQGNVAEARQQAHRAQSLLDKHTPPWLRAQDIEREATRRIEQRDN